MSQETRTFHIDGYDYNFDFSAFIRSFNAFKSRTKRNVTEAENYIADEIGLSREAIHSWRFEKNGPSDIEIIKKLAGIMYIDDHLLLLNKKIGEQNMTTNDRVLDSLKKIYDSIILYLDNYDSSFGYLTDFYDFKDKGLTDDEARNETYLLANNRLHEVEIVLLQEYIILHKLEIYSTLEKFIQRDLCNIWDCKLEYVDNRGKLIDDNRGMYSHEEFETVFKKLNEMIAEYF